MGALFDSPEAPPPPPPPPPPPIAPTVDDARARRMDQDAALQRKGRAATVLTSEFGDLSSPETKKTQLGG